ncbi:MAG: hypothetical protein AABX51_03200 [Nanoarchaeota archaeon]
MTDSISTTHTVPDLSDLLRTDKPFDLLIHEVDEWNDLGRMYERWRWFGGESNQQMTAEDMEDFLPGTGIRVGTISHVRTNPRPGYSGPISYYENGYGFFCGTYASDSRVISQQFIGADLNPDHPLLIMSKKYQHGLFMNGLFSILEHHLGRKFDGSIPTLAYFAEVRDPSTDEITMQRQFVPIADGTKANLPWYGLMPLRAGKLTFGEREVR